MLERITLPPIASAWACTLARVASVAGPLVIALALPACGEPWRSGANGAPDAGSTQPPSGGQSGGDGSNCVRCSSDRDCGGGVCARIGGESFCVALCSAAQPCPKGDACTDVETVAGRSASACVPRSDPCAGSSSDDGGSGSSSGSTGGSSGGGEGSSGSGSSSDASSGGTGGGSSGGPSGSSSSSGGGEGDGGTGGSSGAGSVGIGGGHVQSLRFVSIGDTRPPNVDDTANYPTTIISKIFQDVQALTPRPLFGVSTGDYVFAQPGNGQAQPQLDLYEQARGGFSGVVFAAMGNHECTGATASNCGPGSSDGVTENYTAFMNTMLQPLGQTAPYYSVRIDSTEGAWTAKFVFVAANAWSDAQASWLSSTLAQKTTYTFIVRHEPAHAHTAPGVTPSEQIMANYPYTLAIVGHTHTYRKSSAKEVIFGNGGAPPTGPGDYGFGLFTQRADGAIQVQNIDYSTRMATDTWAVNPDGSPAP